MVRAFSLLLFCIAMDPWYHQVHKIPRVCINTGYMDDNATGLDCTSEDRSQLLRHDSTLRYLITQGSLLRDLCREHPAFQKVFSPVVASLSMMKPNKEAKPAQPSSPAFLTVAVYNSLVIKSRPAPALGVNLQEKVCWLSQQLFSFFTLGFVDKLSKALRPLAPFSTLLSDLRDVHCLLSLLLSHTFPSALSPSTVHQAEGVTAISDVMLNLILPQSLRCPADPYFTQVATHYPHLHRQGEDGLVHYGHFEDTPTEVQDERIHRDMRNNPHYCSGYRAIHWSPASLERSNNLQRPSLLNVVRVAAVISYFTARSIHLKKESSKLLLLAPHNDTIDALEGLMGAAAPDYPPTLYDFYLACIYRQDLLADNLDKFQFTNHQGTTVTPVAQAVSTLAIHKLISADPTLQSTLESRASLPTIVNIALTYLRGFVTLYHF